ncbi:DNA-binding response regulator [Cohnella sp. GbtcB17]|uniref:DNA-binding response regulator n=1 Tax=Cohnella sp. GbtcB17 TaxID=2824762 RepID=UPI001C3046ED|nr:DNA-binding response regulator [Cohnella sp. GbtcB17]
MSDVLFQKAYDEWMSRVIRHSQGERKRRLMEMDTYNERLLLEKHWWPALGSFDHLHPEWEVSDFKDGQRFVDFAYMPFGLHRGLILEADAYGTHLRDVSRFRFGDNLERQNHLLMDGWHMLRFSRDDLLEKPKRCQQTLLAALSVWGYGGGSGVSQLTLYERAILHWIGRHISEIKPVEVMAALKIGFLQASGSLQSLESKGYLKSNRSPQGKTMSYLVLPKTQKIN